MARCVAGQLAPRTQHARSSSLAGAPPHGISALQNHLVYCFWQPHVLRFCDDRGVRDEASVVSFLKSTTMVPTCAKICVAKCHNSAGGAAARTSSDPCAQVPQQYQHSGHFSFQCDHRASYSFSVSSGVAHYLHLGDNLFAESRSSCLRQRVRAPL